MSDDDGRQANDDDRVDEEMARADRANGERPPADEDRQRGADPEAPGTYVDDEDAPEVAEPNEPA